MNEYPPVAHILVPYLRKTETFIYDRIRSHIAYSPFVLTDEPVRNAGQFPFSPIHTLASRPFPEKKLDTAFKRAAGVSPYWVKTLKKQGAKIAHAHYGPVGAAAARSAAAAGVPLVVSFYGIDASAFLRDPVHRRSYKRLFRSARIISVLSSDMGERLVEAGCPEDRIRIHHLAVDTDSLTPDRRETGGESSTFRIVSVGRLVPKKGMARLVRAFAEFIRRVPDAQLQICGTGPDENEVRRAIIDCKLSGKVLVSGYIPRDQVLETIAQADVFALFSVTAPDGDREGTPTVLIEAGALGVPAVSTFHAGIPEVIDHKKTGLLVAEKDESAFAAALLELWEDRQKRIDFGTAAREKIVSEFSIASVIRSIERDYSELLNSK